MNEKYKLGSFGRFIFTIRKKRGLGYYDTPFDIEGAMIIEVDDRNILLQGTDGISYLVTKSRIKHFEPMKNITVD